MKNPASGAQSTFVKKYAIPQKHLEKFEYWKTLTMDKFSMSRKLVSFKKIVFFLIKKYG